LHTVPPLDAEDVVPVPHRRRQDAEQWVWSLVQACVEIVLGERPATQVIRWTTQEVQNDLVARARILARTSVHRHGTMRAPVRPQVHRVRVSFITEAVVEFTVTVRYGARVRAIAGRLDAQADRWVCTALQFG